jgi:class 3 adenylate cyclase
MDPRGFGLSQRDVPFDIDGMVLDIDAVADRLGLEQFSVLGMGLSAVSGLTYAARRPERVTRFVQSPPTAAWSDLQSARMEKLTGLASVDWELGSETFIRTMYPDFTDVQLKMFTALLRESTDFDTMDRWIGGLDAWDATEEAARIVAPTLLLHVNNPNNFIESTRRVAALIPNSQVAFPKTTLEMVVLSLEFALGAPLTGAVPANEPGLGQVDDTTRPTAPADTAVVLFTDIADSTPLTERMGDKAFRDAARALDVAIRGAITEAQGRPVDGKVLGDGVMGVFSSAARAIEAAKRCITASAAAELPLHVGIHAGDVIHEDGNVFGGTVNIAARICGLSAPGEILVSDVIRGMARTSASATFEDRGECTLKGIEDTIRIFAIKDHV